MFFSLFPPVAPQPFDEGQSRASQFASFMLKRILGNSAIPWQGKTPGCHFIGVGPPSPTSRVQHRLKFLAFKTCPNCIGRSWNSCTERPEGQLHSWTAMFTTKHFRRPSLHETISHLCLQKTRHARFLHLRLCLYNQLKCQFLAKTSIFFLPWYVSKSQNVCPYADGMFEQERKMQYLQTWRWSVVPNDSSRDFGPCDRFWSREWICIILSS